MQIRSTLRHTPPIQNQPATPKPEAQEKEQPAGWFDPIRDIGTGLKLVSLGQLYRMAEGRLAKKVAKNPPLADVSNVTIKDPLVIVPGWTTTREAFDPLAEKLVEGGRNGGVLLFVSNGEFYHDRKCESKCDNNFLQENPAKVFEIVLSDVRLPPDQSAAELDTNFKAVKELTGTEKVDVSAYSMGGLATRVYLDRGGKDIDQALFLGTPHRGAKFASLAHRTLTRDIKWALSFTGLIPQDLPALKWLSPVEEGNTQLQELNDRWPLQKANLNEAKFAAGDGIPTAARGLWPIADGDGLVTLESAAPPGEKPVILPGQSHSFLNNSAASYEVMTEYFGWEKAK